MTGKEIVNLIRQLRASGMSDKKDLSIYIEAIKARFAMTDDENKATHKLSTKEVADAINELNPSCAASAQDVYEAMLKPASCSALLAERLDSDSNGC